MTSSKVCPVMQINTSWKCFLWITNSLHAAGTCLKTLVGHRDAVTSVQFNPDGTLVISCSYDGKCCVWDVMSGCCLKSLSSIECVPISHAKISPNGKYLLVSTLDSTLRCGRVPISHAKISPNGGIIYAKGLCKLATVLKLPICIQIKRP